MKNKILIIGIFLTAILIMSVAYSSLATTLKVNSTSTISGEWNIKITDIKIDSKSDEADPNTPTFTDTSVTFDAKLNKPGDFITYEITIENKGTIDAKLDEITLTSPDYPNEIIYENTSPAKVLNKGEKTTFTITVKYSETSTTIPESKTKTITGNIIYSQK